MSAVAGDELGTGWVALSLMKVNGSGWEGSAD